MDAEKKQPVMQVYCPEALRMIEPGEFDFCPYYSGEKLNVSDAGALAKHIFRCHAKCGCPIEYQYYDGGRIVSKTIDIVKDEETLKNIITGAVSYTHLTLPTIYSV